MINTFPPQNQSFKYLQTNRSDDLGSIWSSFNLDFQDNYGTLMLGKKLVNSTTSSDDASLGLPVAFAFWQKKWWSICGTKIFNTADEDLTGDFTKSTVGFSVGDATTQFDVTNPGGTTFRYTYDGTGTDPGISATTFPTGGTVKIFGTAMSAGNEGSFTITGSGDNYFEVTNANGVVESNKTISAYSGVLSYVAVYGGTAGNMSTTQSDMAVYYDYLFVSTASALYVRTFDLVDYVYYSVRTFSSTIIPHKICYFRKYDRLYFIDNAAGIYSIDDSLVATTSGAYTLNPGKDVGYITTMTASSDAIWVASNCLIDLDTTRTNNVKATISQWDGFSSQVTKQYDINASGILAMTSVGDIPYAVDTEGRILRFTGYSFDEVARFPFDSRLLINSNVSLNRFIHHNGMIPTKNNTILFNVNNLNENANSTINENFPSGVWELDLNNMNLTHKHSFSLKAKDSSTVTDYGQNRISAVGAIAVNTLENDASTGRPELLAGATYYTNASDTASAIFITSPIDAGTDYEGQKRGYFVTTWFESPQITSNWTRLWATFKKMLNATDKMIFKYRLEDIEPVEATITWVTQTTFTTTTNVSAYEGFEVEIIQGTGSGACCDITDVSEDGGTYTVTIRSEVPVTATTAKARFQKWIYLGEIASQTLAYGSLPIIANDVRIQIKGILEWTGDNEFTKMAIVSKDDININP